MDSRPSRGSTSENTVQQDNRDDDKNGRGKRHLASESAFVGGSPRLPCGPSLVETGGLTDLARSHHLFQRHDGDRVNTQCVPLLRIARLVCREQLIYVVG